jgi:ligand-binding sensor domain-containing protein
MGESLKAPGWTVLCLFLLPGCTGSVSDHRESDGSADSGEYDAVAGDPGPIEDSGGLDANHEDAGGQEDRDDQDAGAIDGGEPDGSQADGDETDGGDGPEVTPYKVSAMALSPDQRDLWIGTASGAARVTLSSMEHSLFSTHNCGLASNEIVAVLVDRQGDVWFGYGYAYCPADTSDYCGVTRYEPDSVTWTTYTADGHGLLDDRIFSLAQGPDDVIWGGTYLGAIHNSVSGNWGAYFGWHSCEPPGEHCDPIWSYTVADFAFSTDQTMWLAINLMPIGISPKPGGVARRNPDYTTDTWKMDDGLPSHQATAIALVGGTPWMASPSGAAYFQPVSETFLEVTSRAVNDVVATSDGVVWLATSQGAMWRQPDDSWAYLTTADGLPSDQVNVLLNYSDLVCFGTGAGVGCLNLSSGQWMYVH